MNPPHPEPPQAKRRTIEVVTRLDDNVSLREILYAIHQSVSLDETIDMQRHFAAMRQMNRAPKSKIRDALGCLAPALYTAVILAVVFTAMPILFSLGDKILGRNPQVVAAGTVHQLVLTDPRTESVNLHQGKTVRILAQHLEIDDGDTRIFIPNHRVMEIRLERK
jgi:hypothetical protein